jgi:putative copper resistance protein D
MDISLNLAQVLFTACLNIAFALLVGMLLADRALAADDRAHAQARQPLRLLGLSAACVLLACQWLELALQSASMTGTPVWAVSSQLITVLTESHFGGAWLLGYGAALALLAILITHYVRGRALRRAGGAPAMSTGLWSLASLCVALLALAKAAVSHAADAGDLSLPECVHWLHLFATAAWAGLVMVSAWVVLPELRKHATREQQLSYVNGLSHSAAAALLVVLASGGFNAWQETAGSLAGLTLSSWGHILEFKLALVVVVLVGAAINRLVFLPRLLHNAATLRSDLAAQDRFDAAYVTFLRLLTLEAGLMVGLLATAAFLGHSAPMP